MKLFTLFTVKFCSLHSQSEVKFALNYNSLAPQKVGVANLAQTSLPLGNFTFARKLHSPEANLVVEPTCETHDTYFSFGKNIPDGIFVPLAPRA